MLLTTKGIVLKTFKYSETSVIAKVYTEQWGIQSYLLSGVRKKKSKSKMALLQPLSLLELVVYYQENKSIKRVKEMRLAYTFERVPFEIITSSLAIFITEILYKTLKEEENNPTQFQFLWQTIINLDTTKSPLRNYPISFLLQLSQYLGFFPNQNFFRTERPIFDLKEGHFTHRIPEHDYFIPLPLSEQLATLLDLTLVERLQVVITRKNRQYLLQALLDYYKFHVEGCKDIRSIKVLTSVLGE